MSEEILREDFDSLEELIWELANRGYYISFSKNKNNQCVVSLAIKFDGEILQNKEILSKQMDYQLMDIAIYKMYKKYFDPEKNPRHPQNQSGAYTDA